MTLFENIVKDVIKNSTITMVIEHGSFKKEYKLFYSKKDLELYLCEIFPKMANHCMGRPVVYTNVYSYYIPLEEFEKKKDWVVKECEMIEVLMMNENYPRKIEIVRNIKFFNSK